ncbi:hypothetical protein L9F63_004097, partial [Diploptera punctata]
CFTINCSSLSTILATKSSRLEFYITQNVLCSDRMDTRRPSSNNETNISAGDTTLN